MNAQNRVPSSSISESPSLANLQNKANRDQQYLAVRCNQGSNRNSNSADSGSFKAEGNEYIEDICPYATFQLNKQTYSESSYSGNVYSGPYHSVRGSFVYHDVKTDNYHVSYSVDKFPMILNCKFYLMFYCRAKSPNTQKYAEKVDGWGILIRRVKVCSLLN